LALAAGAPHRTCSFDCAEAVGLRDKRDTVKNWEGCEFAGLTSEKEEKRVFLNSVQYRASLSTVCSLSHRFLGRSAVVSELLSDDLY